MRPLLLFLVSLSVVVAGCAEAPVDPTPATSASPTPAVPTASPEPMPPTHMDPTPTQPTDPAPEDPTPIVGNPPTSPGEFTLLGFHEGGSFYFMLEGGLQRNPTLEVEAGKTYTLRLKSVSGFHNVCVGGQGCSDFADAGEESSMTFTAPASGSLEYWCAPHKASGMKGPFRILPSGPTPTPVSPTATPSPATPTPSPTPTPTATTPQQPTASPTPAATASVSIDINNFQFVGGTVSIPVGSTVTWINRDSAPHTATSDTGAFDSGTLGNGASWSRTFNTTGTFPYHCAIHPSMRATITVQ